jgi:hypothetical protein
VNRVVVDQDVQAKLHDVDDVELCDESGRKIGHFLSDELYRRLLYDWANAQISDEELKRRRRQPGGRVLAEIWAHFQEE